MELEQIVNQTKQWINEQPVEQIYAVDLDIKLIPFEYQDVIMNLFVSISCGIFYTWICFFLWEGSLSKMYLHIIKRKTGQSIDVVLLWVPCTFTFYKFPFNNLVYKRELNAEPRSKLPSIVINSPKSAIAIAMRYWNLLPNLNDAYLILIIFITSSQPICWSFGNYY